MSFRKSMCGKRMRMPKLSWALWAGLASQGCTSLHLTVCRESPRWDRALRRSFTVLPVLPTQEVRNGYWVFQTLGQNIPKDRCEGAKEVAGRVKAFFPGWVPRATWQLTITRDSSSRGFTPIFWHFRALHVCNSHTWKQTLSTHNQSIFKNQRRPRREKWSSVFPVTA